VDKKVKKCDIANLFTKNTKLILASNSETRRRILQASNIEFDIRPHKVDEEKIKKKDQMKTPENIVFEIAKAKALSQASTNKEEIIIGSDQILVCDEKIISKAKTKDEAREKFRRLNNKKHKLISAICIVKKRECIWEKISSAEVFLKKMTTKMINKYLEVNLKNALECVGGYKIEEDSMKLLTIHKGNLEDIQGFPISEFITLYKKKK
tara:strand:+ start:514 stop:1140 length:627 start_codon:yes stop_codon:yes gene_type:complete